MKREKIAIMITLLPPLVLIAAAGICAAASGGYPFGNAAAQNDACLSCHGDTAKVNPAVFVDRTDFAHTSHASIGCPVCHVVSPGGHPAAKAAKTDCRDCHREVGEEYAASLHARKTTCAGCHNPHKVKTPLEISGEEINKTCAVCHDSYEMTAKHSEWLPQADLHLRMLPCITCHTSSRHYYISMYIVKGHDGSLFGKPRLASYQELKQQAAGKDIVSLIDTDGDNVVSIEELRAFNRDPAHKPLRLQGMMTPQVATHNFDILDNRRNCTFCHASGPARMQTSYISLPEANGTFTRVQVEKGAVFDALYGTPDFYLMGSTKNSTLNVIGLAIICGGLIMPVGHGSLRFLTRKNRKTKEH